MKIAAAIARIEKAEQVLRDLILKRYPVGSVIDFERAGRIYVGIVRDHSFMGARLRIERDNGSIYWINAAAIEE